jgi:hypothetical protein
LVNGDVTTPKSVCRAGHVKTPYAIRRFIDEAEGFIVVRFQSAQPMAESERIMFAQIFYIPDFET